MAIDMGLSREIGQYTIYSNRQTITVHKIVDVIWVDLICRKGRYMLMIGQNIFHFFGFKIKELFTLTECNRNRWRFLLYIPYIDG